jgi:hypothetical protein
MNVVVRHCYAVVLSLAAAVVLAQPAMVEAAEGSIWREGEHAGADFLIRVPAGWNGGGLVMFAHGYQGEGPAPGRAQNSPLDSHLGSRGIAWAASGFRAIGPTGSLPT